MNYPIENHHTPTERKKNKKVKGIDAGTSDCRHDASSLKHHTQTKRFVSDLHRAFLAILLRSAGSVVSSDGVALTEVYPHHYERQPKAVPILRSRASCMVKGSAQLVVLKNAQKTFFFVQKKKGNTTFFLASTTVFLLSDASQQFSVKSSGKSRVWSDCMLWRFLFFFYCVCWMSVTALQTQSSDFFFSFCFGFDYFSILSKNGNLPGIEV